MNKLIFYALILVSTQAFAADDLETKAALDNPVEDTPALVSTADLKGISRVLNPYQSHWLTSFGADYSQYSVPYLFDGERKDFKTRKQEFLGVRLGLGGELYLGKGIMTTSKVEGYFMGTAFTKEITADPTIPLKYSSTKNVGQVYGFDAVQSLSFLFDMKTKNPVVDEWAYLTAEPFIEAGVGMAQAYNKVNYVYDTNQGGSGGIEERYRHAVRDDILNARIGAGINFTSRQGFMFYMKVTQNRYDITKTRQEGFTQHNGETTNTPFKNFDKNTEVDSVTVYALGGGYKF